MTFFAYLRGMFRHLLQHHKGLLAPLPILLVTGLMGCASIGSPGGGWYDETPPVLVKSDPAEGATGIKKQKITLRFDENVKLDNANEKLTISPPQVKSPAIMSNAKTVTIELKDSLIPNTTYTIDLGDAVQDNNEGNPLEGLSLTFSTGDHIDTMKVSGVVLNAADLEPITGAYVGIYKVYDDGRLVQGDSLHGADSIIALHPDSVFMYRSFERAGKTDAYGRFTISGVAPGSYRMYALLDGNTNYMYDVTTEDVAFLDSLIVPSMEPCKIHDTIWSKLNLHTVEKAVNSNKKGKELIDTLAYDSIVIRDGWRYLPDNLQLRMFNEGHYTLYLDEVQWKDSVHLNVRFATHMPSLPFITLLGEEDLGAAEIDKDSWLICEPNLTNDTLTYWIRDSLVYQRDTLALSMSYLFTQNGEDILRTDTLYLENPKPKVDESKKDKDKKKEEDKAKKKDKKRKKDKNLEDEVKKDSLPKITYMKLSLLGKGDLDIGGRPKLEASAPLDSLDLSGLHLMYEKDSTWHAMEFRLEQDSLNLRRYTMHAIPHFSPGFNYRIIADSASMHDVYGNPVDSTCLSFKEKKTDDYAHLLIHVSNAKEPAFVQLLSEKDDPVQQVAVKNGQAKFVNVPEGKYYARLVEDTNNNGKFDFGSIMDHRQPEAVFYMSELLELRTNWNHEQHWDVRARSLDKQKPKDLIKNKPKEKAEKKSKNEEYRKKMMKK